MPQVVAKGMEIRAAYFPNQHANEAPKGRSFITWLPPGVWSIVGEEEISVKDRGQEWEIITAIRLVDDRGRVRYVHESCLSLLRLVPPPPKPTLCVVRLVD